MGPVRRVRNRMAPRKKLFARAMRNRLTPTEAVLWSLIRSGALGERFRRQSPLYGYIADFYCPAAMLVVEVDGPIHDQQRDRDAARDRHLAAHGLLTLRFSNDEVACSPDSVLNRIRAELLRRTKAVAR